MTLSGMSFRWHFPGKNTYKYGGRMMGTGAWNVPFNYQSSRSSVSGGADALRQVSQMRRNQYLSGDIFPVVLFCRHFFFFR